MRYLLGLLGVVGLIIVVVILIVRGFSGDDAKPGPLLTQYTDSAAVMRFTTEAPVNADKIHQAVRITVGRNESKAEILQGYNETVANAVTYPSNQEAYGVFLRALDLLGFTRGNNDPKLQDARGFCADGNLYTLEIIENGRQIQRYWKTSCDEGNFAGELGKINDLFQAQIPDLDNFIQEVNL